MHETGMRRGESVMMARRQPYPRAVAGLLFLLLLSACGGNPRHRVVVVGIDGMDYKLTRKWIDAGLMPNLAALEREGGFVPLGTSIPPESPVAWSNFISGRNPGGHGIFDFLHREFKNGTVVPCNSMAGATPVTRTLDLFGYSFPLSGGESFNKRHGKAFWEILEEHGIPATLFKIPVQFPPTPTGQKTLSGMGTPDVQGGYGRYYVYTDDDAYLFSDAIKRGEVRSVSIMDGTVRDFLFGPVNVLKAGEPKPDTTVPLTVYIDPERPVAKIVVGDEDSDPEEVVLKEGEWSGFLTMEFELAPLISVSGITRFYLKEVRPNFTLFVEPVNIDPKNPKPDVSTPADWAPELADRFGDFYTMGMPENTQALEDGVLTYDEYREQTTWIYAHRKKMLFDLIDRERAGFFFFYFCSVDLDSHMFWRCMDVNHPGHDPKEGNEGFIQWLYRDVDKTLGELRKHLHEGDTLFVMSDHGFAPYYRAVNLNTWLLENGYAALKEGADREHDEALTSVDWSKTKAYNIGFASIYLNVKGREPQGIVDPRDVEDLTDEISRRLMGLTDPKTGEKVFRTIYKTRDYYSGPEVKNAPEIIVGCKAKYRVSNESTLGMFPEGVLHDNLDPWSGCHLMAAEEVPGVLFSNKKMPPSYPKLYDLTATILKLYGIEPPPEMVGRPIFR